MCEICKEVKVGDLVYIEYDFGNYKDAYLLIVDMIKIINIDIASKGHYCIYGTGIGKRGTVSFYTKLYRASCQLFDSIEIIKHKASEEDFNKARIPYMIL